MNCFQEKNEAAFPPQILNGLYISTAKDPLTQEKYSIEKPVYHPKNVQYLKHQKQQHEVKQELNQKRKAHAQ